MSVEKIRELLGANDVIHVASRPSGPLEMLGLRAWFDRRRKKRAVVEAAARGTAAGKAEALELVDSWIASTKERDLAEAKGFVVLDEEDGDVYGPFATRDLAAAWLLEFEEEWDRMYDEPPLRLAVRPLWRASS